MTPASAVDRGEVQRLTRAVQTVTGDKVDIAYVDQGYTGKRVADVAAAMERDWKSSNCPKPSAVSPSHA